MECIKKIIIFLCISGIVFSGDIGKSNEQPIEQLNTTREILQKYHQWLEKCSSMEYTFSEKFYATKLTNEIIEGQSYSRSGLVRFDKINKRFFVSCHGISGAGFITKEQTTSLENSKFIVASIGGQLKDGKENISDDYHVVSYLDITQNKLNFEGRLGGHVGNSILAFGVFSMGMKYILHDIYNSFQKMNLNFDQQKWQGHNVYRLIGFDKKDRYELWLDPTLQFMPVRISYLCDREMERKNVNYFTFDFVIESFNKSNSIPLPQKYTIKIEGSHRWYEKNVLKSIPSTETIQGEIIVTSVGHSFSEKDFKITMPIPNYTEVSMQDAPQIEYVWLNGEIVPLTDEIALARIRGHGFIPGVREPRFWLITAGIILITLALGLKIKDFFYNNKQKKDD
ncbi:MAG: hypothetical protein LBC02_13600 [Planctomycetaceae bacterium]|jgi:hypothetical protein|nr:hypothetical protein [Planctomycetaceae bacterium]